MTLPSSRRPKDLDELEEGHFIKPSIVSDMPRIPKLRINIPKTFHDIMVAWYENMKPKDKGRLTPTKLKRKALIELSKLNYEYESLPSTWLIDLKNATGMKLYKRIKKDFKRDFEGVGPIEVKVGSGLLPMHLACEGKTKRYMDNSFCTKPEPAPGQGRPRFVDLSHAAPPTEWLAAYRDGRFADRVLTTVLYKDQIVTFYDYDPPFAPGQKPGQMEIHDGNNVAMFKTYSSDSDSD